MELHVEVDVRIMQAAKQEQSVFDIVFFLQFYIFFVGGGFVLSFHM